MSFQTELDRGYSYCLYTVLSLDKEECTVCPGKVLMEEAQEWYEESLPCIKNKVDPLLSRQSTLTAHEMYWKVVY